MLYVDGVRQRYGLSKKNNSRLEEDNRLSEGVQVWVSVHEFSLGNRKGAGN